MRKSSSSRETMKQAAEDVASRHKWSHKMALQIKSLPAPVKTHRSLFFRCWHGWTWRGLIKGHFPGEPVRPAVLFAEYNMQPGCCFPFLSVPQVYLLALLQSARCSQSWRECTGKPEGHTSRRGSLSVTLENKLEFSLLDVGIDLIKIKLITRAVQ